jgi:hypothetical protein
MNDMNIVILRHISMPDFLQGAAIGILVVGGVYGIVLAIQKIKNRNSNRIS